MKLELYQLKGCPSCVTLRDFIEANGLKPLVEYRFIEKDDQANDRLLDITGNDEVPCLMIDDKPLLESGHIIAWIESNLIPVARRAI